MNTVVRSNATPTRTRMALTLENLSRSGALPTLPHVATAALQVARAADVETDHVCDIIRTDVGLTVAILRLANSVVYARRTNARTLSEAVLTIGLRKTCDIMVAAGARQVFGAGGRHAAALWNHALAVGLAAETLATATRSSDAAAAFLAGLFHDVGRIAIFVADPAGLDDFKLAADAGAHGTLERQRYGMDHAEIGAALADAWGLAPSQCVALRWHHDPEKPPVGQQLARLVNAADALAYTIGLGFGGTLPDDVQLARLGLSAEDEAACVEHVGEAFAHYAEVLAA